MCFSAEASFAVGAVLLPAGAYCLREAVRKDRSTLALAVVPLLCGVQQISEGFAWVGLRTENAALVRAGSLGFLFFALALWPFWVTVAAACAEKRRGFRELLAGLAVLQLAWFFVLYLPLFLRPDELLTTRVVQHSIAYEYPDLAVYRVVPRALLRGFYVVSIAVPLVLCSRGTNQWVGVIFGATAVVAQLLFWYAFVSVWCFFAAVLTVYLCRVFARIPPVRGLAGPAGESNIPVRVAGG
jgi:hypothetical protein